MTCEHGNEWLPPSAPWPGGSNPYCKPCWRAAGGTVTLRTTTPPTRGPCLHLGKRVEFRPGCGGRMCLHDCEAGEPQAVPGGVCQRCPMWQPDV